MKTNECGRSVAGSGGETFTFEEICACTRDERSWGDQVEEEEAAAKRRHIRDCGVYGQCDEASIFFHAWQDLQDAKKAVNLLQRTTRLLRDAEDREEKQHAASFHEDALLIARTMGHALQNRILAFRSYAKDDGELYLLHDMEACVAKLQPAKVAKKQKQVKAGRKFAQIQKEFIQVRAKYLAAQSLPEMDRSKSIKCRVLQQQYEQLQQELMKRVPVDILISVETEIQKEADALNFDAEMQEKFGASYQSKYQAKTKVWTFSDGRAVQMEVAPEAPCVSPVESDGDGAGTSASAWRCVDFDQLAQKLTQCRPIEDAHESSDGRDVESEWPVEATDDECVARLGFVIERIVLDVCSPAESSSPSPAI